MGIFDNFSGSVGKIFDPVVNVAKQVTMPFASVFQTGDKYISAVGNKVGDTVDKITDLPGKVVDTVGNLGGKIVDVGGGILNKFTDIISSPFTIILIAGGLFLVVMLLRK
jgi:phage-related protein